VMDGTEACLDLTVSCFFENQRHTSVAEIVEQVGDSSYVSPTAEENPSPKPKLLAISSYDP
jgi:hypothetical protein